MCRMKEINITEGCEMEEKVFKRICESAWHKETELEKFELCPICHSESYHKTIMTKEGEKIK